MERITKPDYKFDMLNIMQGLNKYAEIDEIMNQLAAYEDTGLTPEGITSKLNDYHHIEKVVEGQQNQNARFRRINEKLVAERDTLKKERDEARQDCAVDERLNMQLTDDISTLKKVLEEELADLTTVGSADEKENYTTGYRNGHRNGRIELIKQILKISDGAVKQEEKDNAK